MKLYLAGPMSGQPKLNFPAFHKAAQELRALGHEVVNPAELDEEAGVRGEDVVVTPEMRREAMLRDLPLLLSCDGIAVLPDSEHSGGVFVEVVVANYIPMTFFSIQYDEVDDEIHLVKVTSPSVKFTGASFIKANGGV